MLKVKSLALALIIIGVVANNFVYVNDLFFAERPDWIYFGKYAIVGAAITILVIIAGIVLLWRADAQNSTM